MPDPVRWGPDNPHPLSQIRTELVWDGKYDEYGRRRNVDVAGAAMPMQKIETVDMPRSEALASGQTTFGELSTTLQEDFRNRLIWGDNKLVMASLLKDFRGKIDLIYIDPPFDVGADFTMQVPVGEENDAVEKYQSLLEMVAYRDMWGKGSDSYLQMLFERLSLMKELLSEKGSLYVHVGQEVSQSVRLIGEDIFGKENFVNEIVWRRGYSHNDSKQGSEHFGRIHETIFYFRKNEGATFNQQYSPYSQDYIDTYYKYIENGTGRRYWMDNLQGPGGAAKGNPQYEVMGVTRYWRYSKVRMAQLIKEGRVIQTKPGTVPKYKRYLVLCRLIVYY
jgi:adenine-specific DNA-methyltransferase